MAGSPELRIGGDPAGVWKTETRPNDERSRIVSHCRHLRGLLSRRGSCDDEPGSVRSFEDRAGPGRLFTYGDNQEPPMTEKPRRAAGQVRTIARNDLDHFAG